MDCPDAIDLIDLAIDETLSPEQTVGFREHMDECQPCRNYYEQLQLTCHALRESGETEVSPARRAELIAMFLRESARRH